MVEVNPLVVTAKGDIWARCEVASAMRCIDIQKSRHCVMPLRKTPSKSKLPKHGLSTSVSTETLLPGKRSRSGDGHDGHHQILWRRAANFLDVGGGAAEGQVTSAQDFDRDKKVKAILVNILAVS
jgi:hypothetical protein